MSEADKLWTPGFILLNLQFVLVTCITALFFPFHAYLGHLGFSQEAAGFIIGADALAALVVQPLVTASIHDGTARRWLAGGIVAFSIALFLQGQFTGFLPLVGARLLQGAGFSCVVAALITLIVRSIPPERSGQAFGWLSLARLVPYAAVPLLLDLSGLPPASFGRMLEFAALLALAPLAMVFTLRRGEGGRPDTLAPGMAGIRDNLRSRPVALTLLAGLMLYGGYSAAFFFLREFGTALGIENSGMFFTIATATMMVVRLFGGLIFDRFDKVRLCALGFLVVAASSAVLPLAGSPSVFFGLAFCIGLGWGVVMPLQSAVMFDISPAASRALNQNLLLFTMQAGFFLGPAIGGALLAETGFVGLFAGVSMAAAVAVFLTERSRSPRGASRLQS